MNYETTISVIRAALVNQQAAFAQRTAERWLAAQPGHLTVSVLLAEAVFTLCESAPTPGRGCTCSPGAAGRGCANRLEARRILSEVLGADPENQNALELKTRLHQLDGDTELSWAAAASLHQLAPSSLSGWGRLGRLVTRAPAVRQRKGGEGQQSDGRPGPQGQVQVPEAEFLALIPALAELERSWRTGRVSAAREMAEQLLETHPRLVKAHLILADCLMAQGEEPAAVAHLHQAAALDPGGEVALRIWDGSRPYEGIWPTSPVPAVAGPLPHGVASALGLNLLPERAAPPVQPAAPTNGRSSRPAPGPSHSAGSEPTIDLDSATPSTPVTIAEEALINVQAEISRLAGRTRSGAKKKERDRRVRYQSAYAIVTSRTRLQAKYGKDGWEEIDGALRTLAKAAEAHLRLPAGVLYIDDQASMEPFQLEPVDPTDPWAVKTVLSRLDDRLAEHQQQIGWVLLVGGPDVIPFHRLPNPTDDGDADVPSDNPYGCKDENYFVPQRAVGRLPDGVDGSPALLLRGIATALSAHHAIRRSRKSWLRQWWEMLLRLIRGWHPASQASFGYAASVWRKVSLTVFSKIGPAQRLRISPPLTAAEFSGLSMGPSRYGYFNLHGIADGPAWYGQRDPSFPADYPAFPVALRPQDVAALGTVPEVVLSEACYGALAEGKTPETALCLKFLASGAQMFVGSTVIAYGGLNSAPEAADLLASYFWQEIMVGRSGGVALQQAKVAFAQHLDIRQGYLDGEDQKTLLSFVYYGDPTLTALPSPRPLTGSKRAKRTWKELAECPPTVCAKGAHRTGLDSVPDSLVEEIRTRVASYLPGMERANLGVSWQRACRAGLCRHQCASCRVGASPSPLSIAEQRAGTSPNSGVGAEFRPGSATGRMVFTLHKSAKVAGQVHEQLVKVTVDGEGKMLKLAVSK